MDQKKRQMWTQQFLSIGWLPGAGQNRTAGGTASPDGTYFDFPHDAFAYGPDCISLVVIGRMLKTPYELTEHIPDYRVCGLHVLPPAEHMPELLKQVVLDRGFYRIDFEPRDRYERRINKRDEAA